MTFKNQAEFSSPYLKINKTSFKIELKGIKEKISNTKILIDKSLDDDNFYL